MSATAQKQIDTLLRQHNFRLVRQTKHRVWRNPDGKVFVTSATPSDWRAALKQLSDLKRVVASDPVPEVVAISEYERCQALAKLAGQEKKTSGAAAGPAKSRGCGFSYIDEKKAVTSTLTPEQRQSEREQRAWESLVRKTRQDFVASVVAKHRVIAPKLEQELQRRYLEYADNRMAYEMRRGYESLKQGRGQKCSQMYSSISQILDTRVFHVHKLLGADFYHRAEDCEFCKKKQERIYYCCDHAFERCRVVALNIEEFVSLWSVEESTKAAEKLFGKAMLGTVETSESRTMATLWRYAVRKANELAKQLLAARPMKKAA